MPRKIDPLVERAAEKLATKPNISVKEALILAGADEEVAKDRTWHTKVYKKRTRIEKDLENAAAAKGKNPPDTTDSTKATATQSLLNVTSSPVPTPTARTSKSYHKKILKVAQDAVLLAGSVIREAQSSERISNTKSSTTDLVTETDKQCEEIIRKQIQSNFPSHKIIGEESSASKKYKLTKDPTWTIDPIDGTTNFVHDLMLSCVIISYIKEKEVHCCVIYDPYADDMYYAVKDEGAFIIKNVSDVQIPEPIPIHVSNTTSLSNAVISMDPGYGRDEIAVKRFCSVQSKILSRSVRNIRVIGCTGLNMAFVACGKLDAGFELGSWELDHGPKIWDFAAGKLLVEEAGGITIDIEQDKEEISDDLSLDLMKRSFFCASSNTLANEVLKCISEGLASLT